MEPVYITKNGTGDLAVMSIEALDRITAQFELYRLIDRGFDDARNGRMMSLEESSRRIKALENDK